MKAGGGFRISICGIILLFFSAVLWVAYTGRGATLFAFLDDVPGGDKTGHVALMGLVAFTLSWLIKFRQIRLWKIRVYLGAFVVLVFVTIEEFAQIFSPNRTFDLIDLSCNYLGIALAHWVCFAASRRGSAKVWGVNSDE